MSTPQSRRTRLHAQSFGGRVTDTRRGRVPVRQVPLRYDMLCGSRIAPAQLQPPRTRHVGAGCYCQQVSDAARSHAEVRRYRALPSHRPVRSRAPIALASGPCPLTRAAPGQHRTAGHRDDHDSGPAAALGAQVRANAAAPACDIVFDLRTIVAKARNAWPSPRRPALLGHPHRHR